MSFSLRTLLIFTTVFAVVAGALVYPKPIVGKFFYTIGVLTIPAAAIAALYRRGPHRAYWVGFLLVFGWYYFHSVWPIELRSNQIFLNQLAERRNPMPGLLTTQFLSWLFGVRHGSTRATLNAGNIDYLPESYFALFAVGHTAFAMLLGVAGGTLAQRMAAPAANERPSSEEPPA